MRVVVLASGRGSNFEALVKADREGRLGKAQVVGVLSDKPSAGVLARAERLGVPSALVPVVLGEGREAYDRRLWARLQAFRPDLLVLAGWMRILSPTFLTLVRCPCVNLHPALPGVYPGLRAIERAYEDALRGRIVDSGVMIHHVVAEVDAGPVVARVVVPVHPEAGLGAFEARMHRAEHQLLVGCVRDFEPFQA